MNGVNGPGEAGSNDNARAAHREVLRLVHHHPGRLRVRADALAAEDGDVAVFAAVQRALDRKPGVSRVKHGARAGSLLVEYEPGLADPDDLVATIAEAAGLLSPFDPASPLPLPAQPALAAIDGTRELNSIVHELTGFRADLRTLAPAALAGAALVSFATAKGGRMPRWDNLLYWSYSIFSALHQREILGRSSMGTTLAASVGTPR